MPPCGVGDISGPHRLPIALRERERYGLGLPEARGCPSCSWLHGRPSLAGHEGGAGGVGARPPGDDRLGYRGGAGSGPASGSWEVIRSQGTTRTGQGFAAAV
mgnify:CR=1 FL=1